MSRSALRPYLVPLLLMLGGHILWLYICGGFAALYEFVHSAWVQILF